MKNTRAELIIGIWEASFHLHPLDQALQILTVILPGEKWENLAGLEIADRDRYLFQLREALFGQELDGWIECKKCQEQLDFKLTISEITSRLHTKKQLKGQLLTTTFENMRIKYHLPKTSNLKSAIASRDHKEAYLSLVRSCISEVTKGNKILGIKTLTKAALLSVAKAIAKRQEAKEIKVQLQCPNCNCQGSYIFDIASFLFQEIASKAKSILTEIQRLAAFYGWSETEILSLSPIRRRFYLEAIP